MKYLSSKRAYAVLSILALLLVLPVGYTSASGQKPAEKKNFLWRVKSKKNTVYILGSIHALKKEVYPLNEHIEKAFEDSQKLVVEVELNDKAISEVQKYVLAKGVYTDGKTLQQSVSAETYELFKKKTADLGMNEQTLGPLKPWMIALTLFSLKTVKTGASPQDGIDFYFMQKAKEKNKPIIGLETVEFQMSRFADLSAEDQEKYLLSTLKSLDSLDSYLTTIVNHWLSGDLTKMESFITESFQQDPVLYNLLLKERNLNWIPKIEQYLQEEGNYMVVVGAAHLVGKDGVLELLKKRGYSIEQL
ncbi:MAG: TraB/GumN family protein [Blastocatellia bacterium]|nr:TraB/GumN family protein [Blastocatellia bacterium]